MRMDITVHRMKAPYFDKYKMKQNGRLNKGRTSMAILKNPLMSSYIYIILVLNKR